MIAVAFAHLFSVWLLRSFRKPRELTWVVGFSLFGLLLAFGFSGYLLPWDELSFFATKVGTKIMGSVPVVGFRAMTFLRGGEEVTGETIGRFFAFHICVLPLLTCALVGLHLLFIQIQGVSLPPSLEAKQDECPKMPFFPDFMLHDFRAWAILFGVLVTVAVAFPWGIGRQANPLAPAPAGIRPEWFFLSMFQVFKLLPTKVLWIEGEVVGTLAFMVLAAALLALPFLIQRLDARRRFLVSTVVAMAAIAFLAGFTLLGYVTSEREKAQDRAATQSVAPQKAPLAAATEKLLAQAHARIQRERASFLLYTVGLWGCIIFLVVVIHLRLVHAERCRQMGLQD
jgi:cytochrome b6